MKRSKILFCDMDGTLARFYENAGCVEDFSRKPGFFYELNPYRNVIDAIQWIYKNTDIKVIFLSAAAPNAVRDKIKWLQKHFPEIPAIQTHCLFPGLGENKGQFVTERYGSLKNCVLLDDYSVNLVQWREEGGKGVKLLNELNGRGFNNVNWDGAAVGYNDQMISIAKQIVNVFDEKEGEVLCA